MEFNNIDVVVSGPNKPSSTYKTKVLKGNHSFASQVTEPNTKYVIKYNFVLDGDVTIPKNCILEFDGGSLNNGTIIGSNTTIDAEATKIFDIDITLAGTWNVKEGYPQWFGIYTNDDSVDTTPAIKKMVAVSIPIFFCAGIWYLSECLLNGKANVNLKGETTHYKTGTVFKAFNPNGQRFILKLGGNADFSKPTNYHAIWCSNFVLDGINFDTTNTHFVNANPSMGQNYAAVCFDWCVEGYVNIRHAGACPAVFIANTWEVYFESIICYGSYTNLDESAIYFGKCYTDVVSANISAVTINNLFGETIYGKFVDSHADSNIADLIINNIEFEPYSGSPSHVSHSGESAYSIIENNIRNLEYLYYFNFSGHEVCIHSLACSIYPVTYDNDTIARGLVKAINSATNVIIDNIINVHETYVINILGADNGARLKIGNLISQRWSGNISVYKDINHISDFANTLGVLPYVPGIITIENTNVVIDKDIIKLCAPGLLFNSKNVGSFSTLMWASYRIVPICGLLDGNSAEFIYFNQTTVSKKLKFDGNRLIIRYTAPNKYESNNIIITYYKNNDIVNTESIKLPYSDTKILTYQYDIYADDYDYCKLQFKSSTCIESIYLENIVASTDDQKVVLFGSEINNDVIRIMSHYTRDDAYKRAALQYFFNTIGNIKNKLNHVILPIFANNLEEAIYDIITESQFTNIDGNNYLEFNKPTRRLHMSIEVTSDNWRDGSYSLYDSEETFEGALTILSATDGNGHGNTNFYDNCFVRLNNASLGYFEPSTTNNHKIIGCGIVSNSGSSYLMRLGDKEESDKLTPVSSLVGPWKNTCQIFGGKPSDNTRGVRILVSTGELITADEAKILRDAVIELDDKFAALDEVNDNYTLAVEKLLIPNSGIWNDKPSSANISVGFAYFCTDKHTEEGATDGIMIYYKGLDTTDPNNSVDVWVDALGRVIS